MLTNVPNLVWIVISSPVGTSGHSAVSIDVILEQVCRQKVHLKNSVDWDLVREILMGLNWNEIIRSFLGQGIEFLSGRLNSGWVISFGLVTCILGLPCEAESIYRVRRRSWSRTQTDLEEHRGARHHSQLVYEDAVRTITELSKFLLMNALNPQKSWSTVKTVVFW